MKFFLFASAILYSSLILAEDVSSPSSINKEEAKEIDIAKISEAFGHLIGKNIENIGVSFDIAHVIKGLQDGANGKASPISEEECIEAITAAQEMHFKKEAQENLKKAEAFLKENGSKKGIVSLEEGKLQYKIEKPGKGEAVAESGAPLVRYVGKYLDGTVFGSSKENERLALDETIAGITKGVAGMKEGEKRTLYIHPSLGYGVGGYLPPNALLIFEVEVIKTHVEAPAIAKQEKPSAEIALPSIKTEAVR